MPQIIILMVQKLVALLLVVIAKYFLKKEPIYLQNVCFTTPKYFTEPLMYIN